MVSRSTSEMGAYGHCGSRQTGEAGLRWQEPERRHQVSLTTGEPRRVLLVDDSNAYRRALRMVLESVGNIEVTEAESGERALEILADARPQLVLMDLNLPGLNGIETTAQVMERAPDTVVVGLSIYTDAQTRAAIRAAGAMTLVNKENGISTVLAVLDTYL